MLSPFHWGQGDVQALFGIQHFDLPLNFENLNRIYLELWQDGAELLHQ